MELTTLYNLIDRFKKKFSKIAKFYQAALGNIDREYTLVLESFTFSPKFNKQVPIIRLIGSGAYIVEPAENIITNDDYKCHLHPNDLLKIHGLAVDHHNSQAVNITERNISGEIYLSTGKHLNIYKPILEDFDLEILFTLSRSDIVHLLEARGLYKGRLVAKEIAELKQAAQAARKNNITFLPFNKP